MMMMMMIVYLINNVFFWLLKKLLLASDYPFDDVHNISGSVHMFFVCVCVDLSDYEWLKYFD